MFYSFKFKPLSIYRLFIIASLLIVFGNISCKKHPVPVSQDYILMRSVGFYLQDSLTNQNLVGSSKRYHPDTIKIYTLRNNQIDMTGKVVLDSSNNYYSGIIYLFALVSKAEDINVLPIDLSIFVYLNKMDTDTLQIKKAPFQDINFYWNNNLIKTVAALDSQTPSLIIKK